MPIFAPAAMLTALWIDSTMESRDLRKVEKIFLWVFGCVALLVGIHCTPLYLYAARLYAIGLSSTFLAAVVSVSVLAVLLLSSGAPLSCHQAVR